MTDNQLIDSMPAKLKNPPKGRTSGLGRKFTVSMHPTLVDELDEGFSPMDGLVAIDEIFGELPLLHQALSPQRLRKRAGRRLKVYRGCYDWYSNLGFSYVQIGTTLHVLDLWYDKNPNLSEMDVILGAGQTEGYTTFGKKPSENAGPDQPDDDIMF
jgi:hypothetical protein